MKSFRAQGRGSSSQGSMRGKSISTKVSAPLPVNLPSRRHEKAGHDVSLVSPGSSWASPSLGSTSVLASSSTASSPATDGSSSILANGNQTAQGSDSPQLDGLAGSPLHRAAPRAWGVISQTADQHLDEYPTAAEAAKKNTAEHHENHSPNGSTHTPHTSRINNSNLPTAGEAMSKSTSSLSTENKWDEVDDESVDFLNAEAIEFADGSVVVAATVAAPTQEETRANARGNEPVHREERVVDRGDVGFDRSWPSRNNSGSGPSLYQPTLDAGPRFPAHHDKPHPQLWQGGPPGAQRGNDRRPSVDRTPGPFPNQRRESAGHKEHYPGAPRRESVGSKDSFSGPPRRDSAGHRDPYYEHRDSFEQRDRGYTRPPRNFSRDREFSREGDFNGDRRPSHDRPPHSGDRLLEKQQQRDVQVLSRPKDFAAERHGPHDAPLHPHAPQPPSAGARPFSHTTHDPLHRPDPEHRIPGYAHLIPPGVVEFDRPAQVTQDQKQAMRQAAEDARKRHQEEERAFEEARARAKAKADELAKKAEEAKKVKEAAELAKAKELEAIEAEKAAKDKALKNKAENEQREKLRAAEDMSAKQAPSHPRDRPHMKTMTDSEKRDAVAQWQSYPDKLAKEEKERVDKIKEARRVKQEEEKKLAQAPSSEVGPTVGPWRRSGNVVTGKGYSSTDAPSKSENAPTKDEKTTFNGPHGSTPEVTVSQLDKVMHNISERLHPRGTLALENKADTKKSFDASDLTALQNPATPVTNKELSDATKAQPAAMEKTAPKERTRHAKQSRADRDHADADATTKAMPSLKQGDAAPVVGAASAKDGPDSATVRAPPLASSAAHMLLESKEAFKDGQASLLDISKPKRRLSRSAALAIERGQYPAKTGAADGSVKISDISRIHARLSKQAAGDVVLEQDPLMDGSSGTTLGSKSKVAEVKRPSTKRNSLSNSTVATIFPSSVEMVVRNRGRLSFMVASEIDSSPEEASEADTSAPSLNSSKPGSAWGDNKTELPHPSSGTNRIDISTNDNAKTAWDSTTTLDSHDNGSTSGFVGSSRHDGTQGETMAPISQGMATRPGMYMINASAAGALNAMPQHMWSSADTSQGPPMPGMIMAPGGGAGHPVPPYIMPPYYHQGYPANGMYIMYPPRGHLPPPMGQFSPAVIPPQARHSMDGSLPMSPRDSMTAIAPVEPTHSNKAHGTSTAEPLTSKPVEIPLDHHWLPRFSAAGDAPQQQTPYLVPVPQPQIMAANINRAPQSRPFGPAPHSHRNSGPAIESASPSTSSAGPLFQAGSGSPSLDSWSAPSRPINPQGGNNTWVPGNGRMSNGGNRGDHNNNSSSAESSPRTPYGPSQGFQQPQGHPPSFQQHGGHPGNNSHRGGRGGYNSHYRGRGGYNNNNNHNGMHHYQPHQQQQQQGSFHPNHGSFGHMNHNNGHGGSNSNLAGNSSSGPSVSSASVANDHHQEINHGSSGSFAPFAHRAGPPHHHHMAGNNASAASTAAGPF